MKTAREASSGHNPLTTTWPRSKKQLTKETSSVSETGLTTVKLSTNDQVAAMLGYPL